MAEPNRWLHLRHPQGFSDERFEQFRAHCRVWRAHVAAVLENWARLPLAAGGRGSPPNYKFFEPKLSADRTTVSLPLGGASTIGSRALIENACSRLLWQYFPIEFLRDLEEGLTETIDPARGPQTNWRRCLRTTSPGPTSPQVP